MTDLDFDEIDRAVNSATGAADKTVNDETPVENKQDSQPDMPKNPESNTDKPKPALAGRRSSGQFMDVVHPSSNMRRSTIVMPERPTSPKPADTSAQSQPVEKPAEIPDEKPTSDWPDPIDFNQPKDAVTEKEPDKKPEIDEDDDIDKINQEITEELDGKPTENPPETPFIPGTKVEKRPLGAFSDDKEEEKSDEPTQKDETEKPEETSASGELSSDDLEEKLVQIESDDTSKPEDSKKVTTPEKTTPRTSDPTPIPAAEHQAPIEATSINQQYQEKPSTGEKTSGAIYDTEAYHKALAHPPKKKSGWMWVVWILLIIALGAVCGILLYLYVIPSL